MKPSNPVTTFHPAIFDFLKQVKEHNTREFFAFTKPLYEQIQENLIDRATHAMTELHRQLGVDFGDTKPKDCMFRIYRDARRIKEGDPIYKENFGMVLGPNGKHDSRAKGFYLHIQSGKSFFGGGLYWPEPADLTRVRQYISLHGEEYYKIVQDSKFIKTFGQVTGDSLVKLPKGFDENTKYPELVKMKQFLIQKSYTDKEVLSENFLSQYISDCKIAKPFFDFLNKGCDYGL